MSRLLVFPVATLLIASVYTEYDQQAGKRVADKAQKAEYPEHLTGAFTGGFGEETCRSCHFDYDLNPKEGTLTVSGIPKTITAGETVEIDIAIEREALGATGFQMSARYNDGSQAGRFLIENDDRLMFSQSTPDSLQYVQHSSEGSKPSSEKSNSWKIWWQSPENPQGSVIFNIAANAGNGDQSEFGDYIYVEKLMRKIEG